MIGKLLCRLGWHDEVAIKAPRPGIAFVVFCHRCGRVIEYRIPPPKGSA
ncbi:MAG: hypothetical protein LM550_07005 [Candidatus Contendobacter sp.]|jgi:hypothetical protein|nr:hypothetical protein [Gammaproteobacteria bacterium]MCC8993427.1 hypothetical protein [Candidatus Contendobacter sp.]